jgi:hypothetical protein
MRRSTIACPVRLVILPDSERSCLSRKKRKLGGARVLAVVGARSLTFVGARVLLVGAGSLTIVGAGDALRASVRGARFARVRRSHSVGQHRLDIDDRCAVDGFDGSYPKTQSRDLVNRHAMEAQRVRSVWRSRREDAGQPARAIARIHFQHITRALMQPSDDDDLIAACEAVERIFARGAHLEPRVGRAFIPLPRRTLPLA